MVRSLGRGHCKRMGYSAHGLRKASLPAGNGLTGAKGAWRITTQKTATRHGSHGSGPRPSICLIRGVLTAQLRGTITREAGHRHKNLQLNGPSAQLARFIGCLINLTA